jgi:hypothetical protein
MRGIACRRVRRVLSITGFVIGLQGAANQDRLRTSLIRSSGTK